MAMRMAPCSELLCGKNVFNFQLTVTASVNQIENRDLIKHGMRNDSY
jgi:hypothetical protein